MFKIGDKVKVIIKNSFADVGDIGIVTEVCDYEVTVNLLRDCGGWGDKRLGIEDGHGEYFEPDELELIKEPFTTEPFEYVEMVKIPKQEYDKLLKYKAMHDHIWRFM